MSEKKSTLYNKSDIKIATTPSGATTEFTKFEKTYSDDTLWMLKVDSNDLKNYLINLGEKADHNNTNSDNLDEKINQNIDHNVSKVYSTQDDSVASSPSKAINQDISQTTDSVSEELKNMGEFVFNEAELGKKYFDSYQESIQNIVKELKGRIQLNDDTYPKQSDEYPFEYFLSKREELNYSIYKRKNLITNTEEIILDLNELAAGKPHFNLSFVQISHDHKKLAYGVNFNGNERFDIKVKDLQSSKIIDEYIINTVGNIVWHNNGFFYTPATDKWLAKEVFYYDLDTKQKTKLYTENIEKYSVNIAQSDDLRFLFLISGDHNSGYTRIYDIKTIDFAKNLLGQEFYTFEPRDEVNIEISNTKDALFILTNENSPNFEIQRLDLKTKKLTSFIAPSDIYITKIDTTSNFLIIDYKKNANSEVRVIDLSKINSNLTGEALAKDIEQNSKNIKFEDQIYVSSGEGTNYIKDTIWIAYSSLHIPDSIYSYDFETGKLTLLKRKEILGGYNSDDYEVDQQFAGEVPISLVYKKSLFKKNGSNPLHLLGYGAYGLNIEPSFSMNILPLLDRGFVCAIAHIRGGSDKNYQWYLDGKLLNKLNTFKDFHDVTKFLIEQKFTKSKNIVIESGSAGGLLIGYMINNYPELYKAAIARAPFVDLLLTMMDKSLPLTQGEYNEWGNPDDKKFFNYMKQYDVIMNTKAVNYPALLITSGIGDPRVYIHEPIRWMAKIRKQQSEKIQQDKNYVPNLTVFSLELDSGHFGGSGRDKQLSEAAKKIVFILNAFESK